MNNGPGIKMILAFAVAFSMILPALAFVSIGTVPEPILETEVDIVSRLIVEDSVLVYQEMNDMILSLGTKSPIQRQLIAL